MSDSTRLSYLALAFLFALALLAAAVDFAGAGEIDDEVHHPFPRATVRDLISTESSLSFILESPVDGLLQEGELQVEGLAARSARAGYPALPYFTAYVALPPEAKPRLTLTRREPSVSVNVELPAVPLEVVDTAPILGQPDRVEAYAQDSGLIAALTLNDQTVPGVSAQGGLFPSTDYDLSEPMILRDLRLVRISLFPYRYDTGRQQLAILPQIQVTIDFEPDSPSQARRPASSHADQHIIAVRQLVLNPEQIEAFRSLPADLQAGATELPSGKDLFRLAVVEEGIYQVTYEELNAAGMSVETVAPSELVMLYRGQPMAFDFVGDADANFEPGESIRFYGRGFSGSRLERQFVNENYYWIWSGGQSKSIPSKPSLSGQPVTTFMASVTREPELFYFQGYTADWPENEPDAWYWDRFNTSPTPITRTYSVTLAHPAPTGPSARFTAEFSSRDSHITDHSHEVTVSMNGHPNIAQRTWTGEKNLNVSATVPIANVLDGENTFKVVARTTSNVATMALNRITVEYTRKLIADLDQLIFSGQSAGQYEYTIQNFGQSNGDKILIWDVTDPLLPIEIRSTTVTVTGSGPYSYTFGAVHQADAKFIVTTANNLLQPKAIERYVAPPLDPLGGADWLAIAHHDFLTETLRLAAHRADPAFGALSTHVVDVEDVINQYGYGLPVPAAIQEYLRHAMAAWSVKPSYVLLVGDTTLDPRGIGRDWAVPWEDPQYTLTDLVFVDRYNGQIPSDHSFSLVSGSDELPDLAVGRVAASSQTEIAATVDKIIHYDQAQRLSFGWMQNMLFVADRGDPFAGDFCFENQAQGDRLPDSLNFVPLCLDDYPGGQAGGDAIRNDMISFLEDAGVTVLNYRGHGAINYWGGNPIILNLALLSELDNERPFVTISADCLDGHYAYPPWEGLGERLVSWYTGNGEVSGAAAHWGSSGLGVTSDHTAMLQGFYDGIFGEGLTALGDASVYSKLAYALELGHDPALMYSFNLQGDPAMHLMRPSLALEGSWLQKHVNPGDRATMYLEVHNSGVFPAHVTLVGNVPPGLSISKITSSVASTVTYVGNSVEIALQFGQYPYDVGMPRNARADITVIYDVDPAALLGRVTGRFVAKGGSLEAWPGNELVTDHLYVVEESVWLPTLGK